VDAVGASIPTRFRHPRGPSVCHCSSGHVAARAHQQEMRLALEAGVPSDELVAPIAHAVRDRGLDSIADRLTDAARRAKA
jgi:hypothetical protein